MKEDGDSDPFEVLKLLEVYHAEHKQNTGRQ